jgi:branched-chain amino acid transport system substrate-binding protein
MGGSRSNLKRGIRDGCLWILALFLPLVAGSGCSRPGKIPAVLRIGVLLPLSGKLAAEGQDCRRGIGMALAEINADGGIKGHDLELLYEDSGGTPQGAASGMEKLIQKGSVQAVIGGLLDNETEAAAAVAEKRGIVLISPGCSESVFPRPGGFVFRVRVSDAAQGRLLADFARRVKACSTAAVFHGRDADEESVRNGFSGRFEAEGGKVVFIRIIEPGTVDFRSQLSKMAQRAPGAVFLPGHSNEIVLILKQAREMGIRALFLGAGSLGEKGFLARAGSAAEGMIYAEPAIVLNDTSTAMTVFKSRFRNWHGCEPGVCAANGYDALYFATAAVREKGNSAEGIRDALCRMRDLPGVFGKTSFDPNGDAVRPLKLKTIRGGIPADLEARRLLNFYERQ